MLGKVLIGELFFLLFNCGPIQFHLQIFALLLQLAESELELVDLVIPLLLQLILQGLSHLELVLL